MDPISTKIALGAAGAGGGESYWIATLGGSSNELYADVVLDSSDNIYAAGETNSIGTGQFEFLLTKYDKDGALQWQRISGVGNFNQHNAYCLAIVPGGTSITIAGRQFDSTNYSDAIYQSFFTSGGYFSNYRRLQGSGTAQEYFTGAARNSSGDIYLAGYTDTARFLLAKYNSSNTLVWQKTYGGSYEQTYQRGKSLALDSSDNMYIVGWTNSGPSTNNDAVVTKFDSSGTLQWQRGLGKPGNDYFTSVCLDSSNNVYAVGYTDGTSQEAALIAKYNSSGTLQWQRTLDGGLQEYYHGVCVDSSDNVYACGRASANGGGSVLIVKYNSSGTIQWQRLFYGSAFERAYSIQCDSNDNLIVVGQTATTGGSNDNALVLKLPSDGSLTGTYGSYTYTSVSYTDAASSLTDAALSFSVSTGSLTSSALANTTSTGTLTSSTTTL